jgi:hypothetical protein
MNILDENYGVQLAMMAVGLGANNNAETSEAVEEASDRV